jgi:hypothetical protein
LYARVRPQTMSRWVFGRGQSSPVIESATASDEKIVSFVQFIESLTVRSIRNAHGISLQKIREAWLRARNEFRLDHPFAVPHRVYLFGDLKSPRKCETPKASLNSSN